MTQFIELALDWNRGQGFEPATGPRTDPPAAALEVPCTEGTTVARGDYAAGASAAQARGMMVIASHVLSGTEAPADQAAALARLIDDQARPVMLLPSPNPFPGVLDLLWATADHMTAAGLHPRLVYIPQWYWAALGQPSDLFGEMVMRRLELIAEPQLGPAFYPGDDSSWWNPGYGGFREQTTAFLRSNDRQDGTAIAAFRGTLPELRALLGQPALPAVGIAPVLDPPAAA